MQRMKRTVALKPLPRKDFNSLPSPTTLLPLSPESSQFFTVFPTGGISSTQKFPRMGCHPPGTRRVRTHLMRETLGVRTRILLS
jgi:hypothetical protein